eukprot:16323849-Heterocapsa_arctica.AAC.1
MHDEKNVLDQVFQKQLHDNDEPVCNSCACLNDEPMKFMHSEHYRQGRAVGGDDVVDEGKARRWPRRSTMAS